jgi:hypothetical protein
MSDFDSPVNDGREACPKLDLSWVPGLLLWAAIIAGLWYGGPCVKRWFARQDEIRPHEYAHIEQWDTNDWTHDYIQESLSDGVITNWEYNRIYWLQNKGLADSLKDK